jgi:hypothetical protein
MRVSLAQAAKATGRSRSTILRTIRAGKLSAERDELTGAWSIDISELARVFPVPANIGHGGHDYSLAGDQVRTGEADTVAIRLAAAEGRPSDALDQIADLRHRLDEERSERRQTAERLAAAQERIAALLTDQRPATPVAAPPSAPARRKWWPWSRG